MTVSILRLKELYVQRKKKAPEMLREKKDGGGGRGGQLEDISVSVVQAQVH